MRLLTLYQIKDRTEVTKTVNQGVYALRNSVDGKVYVGSSESISSRINRHFSELRAGVHRNHHLQHAFRLYGKSAFEFFILEQVNDAFWLRPREHAWILRLQATDHKHGYNISEDAWSPLSGVFQSEERKSRFLDAHRSPKPSCGILSPLPDGKTNVRSDIPKNGRTNNQSVHCTGTPIQLTLRPVSFVPQGLVNPKVGL